MRKEFNVTGSCNPQWHYMVMTEKRFKAVEGLIDRGKYFTINRARQYGKTTMLNTIWRNLSDRYLVIPLSFEGLDNEAFATPAAFVATFRREMARLLATLYPGSPSIALWQDSDASSLEELSVVITAYCKACEKPIVLTIDEVDKSSDNQLFLDFLGLLRNKYLVRDRDGMDSTFHSVVLAGVYDVKNLKLKLLPNEERKYNSPWNIASDFNVDMTFHPDEIAQMLGDYETDVHSGMDIQPISNEIYKYTTGYPFLVSCICKLIDERLDQDWTANGVQKAVKIIAKGEGITLIDDLSKNIEHNTELRNLLYSIVVNGQEYSYSMIDPIVRLANMFSYIRENQRGKTMIHNLIFEEVLFVYFSNQAMREQGDRISPFLLNYVRDGRLNMEHVVTRFRDLMHEEYRERTVPFLEREGRLLFLTFLKPIINGIGFYYVEPQTRDNRRMDLVVTYDRQEFVVELKIWRGDKYEESGRDQLSGYLAARGINEGYLVTFDFSKHRHEAEPHWIDWNGKRIFEVII
ncbi:MAG: AAA-like domain-containing protein [Muribaculaceae bacterium]|nr:AAA-like domain-containing protein [Muribaculaceae bacterium]